EMRGLPRMVAETPVGKAVDVTVWRKGKQVELNAQVGEYPENDEQASAAPQPGDDTQSYAGDNPAGGKIDSLGVALAAIDDKARAKYNLPDDTEGVLVTDVDQA